jgi:hypothetical protein
MTHTYQVEELDAETRDYLYQACEKQGKDMPGIFAAKPNSLPLIGMGVGFGVMIVTVMATFPPTLPPTKEACLQTAGFLLGGWMVIAAMRVWMSGKSGKYVGHFVYADAENLYEGNGGNVHITDLGDLRDAKAVQNFNSGKYQNTSITIKVRHDRRTFQVNSEERGRRMTVFLNAISYMRDGGDDGQSEDLKKLSPETMGAVAKQVAKTGEFPHNYAHAEEAGVARVPRPRKDGRASTGMLAMFLTIAAGTLMFFGFRSINGPLREETIFSSIKSLPSKEQPPALRLYLANPDFNAHREEAQKLLDDYYDNGARNNVNGTDAEMKNGMSEVVLSLKSKPQPVVSLVVAEEQAPPGQDAGSANRESQVQQQLADKWGSTIGDELVVFAAPSDPDNPSLPDKKSKGMIDLRWKFTEPGTIEYTIEFRKSPDDEAIVSKRSTVVLDPAAANLAEPQRAERLMQALINQVLQQTLGGTRDRPPPPPPDVDF